MHKNDNKYKNVKKKHKTEVELAISLCRLTELENKTKTSDQSFATAITINLPSPILSQQHLWDAEFLCFILHIIAFYVKFLDN